MTYKYEVPFELTFNKGAPMDNLVVTNMSVEKESSEDNSTKFTFAGEKYIELTNNLVIEPFPESDKQEIIKEYPDAVFEDTIYNKTTISSDFMFNLQINMTMKNHGIDAYEIWHQVELTFVG